MKFIIASASCLDYTEALKSAGIEVRTETEIIVSQFMEIKTASTGTSKRVIEIDTLADLMKVKEAVGHDIVIGNDWDFKAFPVITVYDGYLE